MFDLMQKIDNFIDYLDHLFNYLFYGTPVYKNVNYPPIKPSVRSDPPLINNSENLTTSL